MTTTHVFIVDITTFKLHLEYLFVGTGASDHRFNIDNHPSRERNLIGMSADANRVRKGDFVIFYLQQNFNQSVYEGKFYGIFQIKENESFLDDNDGEQFLKEDLKKSLIFRTLIEPFKIYPQGVSEWSTLDEIKNIQSPNQMLWSLIYRKLKGNRGNTMITEYESERLFKLIRDENKRKNIETRNFTFNVETQSIESNNEIRKYTGRKEKINILSKLIKKYNSGHQIETHLQSYITQNIGKNSNSSLDKCLLKNLPLEWLGNEVSCGVGMQRIDIMLSLIQEKNKIVVPIELKSTEASPQNCNQLQRYIDWIEQYYIPNQPSSDIQPVIIAKKMENKSQQSYKDLIKSFVNFNEENPKSIALKYIEFFLEDREILFEIVEY